MKLSVTSYSYLQYINKGLLDIFGVVDKTAELGFDGIEFSESAWADNLNIELAKKLRARCEERGLYVVSFCSGSDFLKDGVEATVAKLKRAADFAEALGAKKMRLDITRGFVTDRKYSIGYDDAIEIVVPAIREIADYAAAKGIITMTENHGQYSQDVLRVEKLINTVAHPNFGALLDLGNFICADEDPVKSTAILAPYAVHVHAKDFYFKSGCEIDPGEGWSKTRAMNYIKGAIIGHGVCGIYQSVQILKKVGYDGFITVEFEGKEDCIDGIRIGKDNLTRFIS